LNPDNKIAIIQKSFFKYYQLRSITCERFADANQNEEASEKLRLKLVEDASKLEPILEKYNDIAEGFSLLAQIYSELRDYEKAERYYKVSLEIDPLNSGSIVNRALNQIQMTNDFESSISMIQEAMKIDETSSYPYAALANIEIQRYVWYSSLNIIL
jgi:tetratricopeptide (TPR) repeat protein